MPVETRARFAAQLRNPRGWTLIARPRAAEDLPPRVRRFIWAVAGLAALLWVALEWKQPLTQDQWTQIALWLVLGLLAHAGEFEINRPGNAKVFLSAGFAVSSIAMAQLPVAGAMVAVAVGSLTLNEITENRHPGLTVVFNRGALALCAAAGSTVFHLLFGALPAWELVRLVGASLAASIVYGGLSIGIVSTVVALRSEYSLRLPWLWPLGGSLSIYWNYLALGMLGDLILTMYRVGQLIGLVLAVIPLVVTYFSLRQTADLRRLYNAIVSTLVDSLDLRDRDTGGHTRRVAALSVRLGRRLGLQGQALDDLRTAALLHDLGKIGVPDAVLLKPDQLTGEERAKIEQHPQLGADLLSGHGLLSGAIPSIRHHQEWFDGRGYPDGLSGEAIPLGARIIAVADAFMAMVDGRPYRKRRPFTPGEAYAELERYAGTQFDRRVVASLQPVDWESVLQEAPPALGAQLV